MIKRENLPEGWWLEKGDPSVGIFGDQWIHDYCLVLQGPGNDETQGVEETTKQVADADRHGMAVVTYSLNCKDCGQQTVFDNEEFVGVPEAA